MHQHGAVTASLNTVRTQSEGTIENEENIRRLENFIKKKQDMDQRLSKHQ